MGDVLIFKPRQDFSAEKNLLAFEEFCRTEIVLFGSDLPFDDDIWDVTNDYPIKGSSKRNNAIFSSYEAAQARTERPAMSPHFIGFAKSYFRHSLSLRSSQAWSNRLAALRVLDYVLRADGLDGRIAEASRDTFSRACNLIRRDYASSTAPKIAGQLEDIAEFLLSMGSGKLKAPWKSPLKRQQDENIRIGEDADEAREQKLPSKEAIEAVAYIFQNPSSPAELVVTSTVALLYCFPQRINEVVRLPFKCEVEFDQEMRPHYGLRAVGSKGFDDSVRWILPTMEAVARKAVSNLKEASKDARNVALWYEKNPTKIYLLPEYEYLRLKEFVDQTEVGMMLYGQPRPMKSFCANEKIKQAVKGGYRFSDIEKAVLQKLPADLLNPATDIKYSESLFICHRFYLDATLKPYSCIVDRISTGEITSRLTNSGSAKSIFEKRGLTELDGSSMQMKSHQARHYLNTLAQSNGASQLDIAMWSGRANPAQNAVYDHVTPGTLLSKAKEIAISGGSQLFAGVTTIPKIRVVAHRDDATGRLITGTAHATLYGMCRHDFASSPCPIHRDCLNCHEHICVKGAHVKLANIKRMHDETEGLLAKAQEAEGLHKYGASRWVEHQKKTLEHCKQLISILENNVIADGALVALNNIRTASTFEQVTFMRQEKVGLPRQNKLLERLKRNGKK